ncbi:NAD(P)-dependent alcohol dehydrogenase [Pseudonocardia halophobica]|uniref:Zinc-containing alcohol dehydrogenase n=1 Tax=Pseudonocardia halophobica TaxID=29401 RepID=A0A9W6NVG6_9PSEU|nr:NAD(P)-dependent alcohol dehydrogenase [Pseudonocardia halophobica]GLL10511.1 putative zinc-containing alcohol dehydrogenase [Pseudonocardia halophobica]
MRTEAAISRGAHGDFTIEDVDIDDPRPDELLVRLVATGVCHTDLLSRMAPPDGAPAVLGHEGAGVVESVGAEVDGFRAGDKVLLSYAHCGRCRRCAAGRPAYCAEFGALNSGGTRPDGSSTLSQAGAPVWSSFFGQSSFARHAIVSPRNAVVVSPDTDLVTAAPMGCGFQTGAGTVVNVMRPDPGSSLVVFGTGGVGVAAVMAARALDVETVVAVDLSEERRAVATKVGATATVDGAAPDVVERLRDLTGGGAGYVLDTTAVPSAIGNAFRALGPLGTLVLVGIGAPEIGLDTLDLIGSGKSVRGSIEGDSVSAELIPRLLAWQAAGRFPVDEVVTRFPFEHINHAVEVASGAVVKPVLTF